MAKRDKDVQAALIDEESIVVESTEESTDGTLPGTIEDADEHGTDTDAHDGDAAEAEPVTVATLERDYPEIVKEISQRAYADGVNDERERQAERVDAIRQQAIADYLEQEAVGETGSQDTPIILLLEGISAFCDGQRVRHAAGEIIDYLPEAEMARLVRLGVAAFVE